MVAQTPSLIAVHRRDEQRRRRPHVPPTGASGAPAPLSTVHCIMKKRCRHLQGLLGAGLRRQRTERRVGPPAALGGLAVSLINTAEWLGGARPVPCGRMGSRHLRPL